MPILVVFCIVSFLTALARTNIHWAHVSILFGLIAVIEYAIDVWREKK